MTDQIIWPDDDVVILCGASFSNEQIPWTASPPEGIDIIPGGRLAGGSFMSGGEALTVLGHQVANVAEAGAYSFDFYGWNGYSSQLSRGLISTGWIDGNHAKVVVFDQMNDCLHTVNVGVEGMTAFINNLMLAVDEAIAAGLKVIVTRLIPFEAFNLPLGLAPYGITYTISAEDYEILNQMHIDAFSAKEGMVYLDVFKQIPSTIDGLHLDYKSTMGWAKEVSKAIRKS